MSSEADATAPSEHAWVILASFDSYRHAEHLFASLGRPFRKKARKDGTTAVVVRANPDGSLKLTQSRVLTASGLASALIRISLSWTVGFMGLVSTLKGTKGTVHAAHVREGRVGSDEHAAHDMLAAVGPDAALALVRGSDPAMHQLVLHARARLPAVVGTAHSPSFLPGSTQAARTIGCVPLWASRPAQTAKRSLQPTHGGITGSRPIRSFDLERLHALGCWTRHFV